MCGCLSCTAPTTGTWPATQVCALTGNGTGDPLVPRLALSPLSHTSQNTLFSFKSYELRDRREVHSDIKIRFVWVVEQ